MKITNEKLKNSRQKGGKRRKGKRDWIATVQICAMSHESARPPLLDVDGRDDGDDDDGDDDDNDDCSREEGLLRKAEAKQMHR